MDAQEYAKDFLEGVRSEAAATGEGKCAVFVRNVAQQLVDAEVLPDFEGSFYTGTGRGNRKFRVDGYILDEFDMAMNLIIADFDEDPDRILAKTGISQCLTRLSYFAELALNGSLHDVIEPSTPCADLADIIHTYKDRIRKFKYHIFTDASVSATIKTVETQPIGTIPTDCQVWSLERLFRICSSDLARQSIEIDFSQFTTHGIPCLPVFDASTDDFHSYLCVIPGKILADIYDEYGSALLEGNVRSFLSTKVAVNKKIRETILSKPDRFFAFNNGISATALNVELADTPQGRFVTKVKDFQIINGGQTTASLSNARFRDKADLSSIFVQMKLTEIDETDADKSTELIRNISKSSNSQNKVRDADFFATSPFHIRMEQFSRRMFANASDGSQYETHWFYERARGQYLQAQMRLTPAKKKQFQMQNPKNQLITKTDLAKVMVTWRGRPDIVSRGAQTCFMWFANITDAAWEEDNEQFNEKYYQEAVALTIMHRYLEKAIPMQHWYESGYRANVITYSFASLHHLLSKQKAGLKLDLAMIWIRQTVPDVLCSVLLHIAEIVYSLITSEDRKVVNVTQWCKREECWKYVLAHMSYKLPDEIDSCLCSTDAQKSQERSARKVQRIDSGVEYQKRVLEHDALFWGRLAQFAASKRLLNENSASALKLAVRLPEKLPNSVQCAKLLELLEAAKSEGFKEQE